MFCGKCGAQLSDSFRYCPNCGTAIRKTAATPLPEAFQPYAPEDEVKPKTEDTAQSWQSSFLPYDPVEKPTPPASAEAEKAPGEDGTPPAPKKKRRKLLPVLCAVAAVAAAVAAAALRLPRTVYLITEHTVDQQMSSTRICYEYDDAGRIIRIKHKYQLALDSYLRPEYEISYSYNSLDKPVSAVIEYGGQTATVSYHYTDGVLTDLEIDGAQSFIGSQNVEVECDDQGRLTHIAVAFQSGITYSWEFAYYENGTVKERRRAVVGSLYFSIDKTVERFDENGHPTEVIMKSGSTTSSRIVYKFGDCGELLLQEIYDGSDELTERLEIKPTYLFGRLTSLVLTNSQMEDGELQTINITFDCDWIGTQCHMTVKKAEGSSMMLEKLQDKQVEIHLEKDRSGNTVEAELTVNGESYYCAKTEYKKLSLPRDYRMPNATTAPEYLYFLLNP